MRIAPKIAAFLQRRTSVPLAECSLLQLAQALRVALACGTGLSTLKDQLCCPHNNRGSLNPQKATLTDIQLVPSKRILFFEGEALTGVPPFQLKKVPTVKLTIANKQYVIRLHPSTDEEIPTLHFLIKAQGALNPLFLQPLLDIATSPHQQQLLCASPFSTGTTPSNTDLLQQLASTYLPDLPNSSPPFQDVNMHLTAKINPLEIEKVHLQLRTPTATYTYPHFCSHRKRYEIDNGFIPLVPPSEIRMFLQWLLIRYTTFHLFQQPTTCKLLRLTSYNQYEAVPVHPSFEFLLLHWDNLCVQLTPTAESAPSESSPNICQLSYITHGPELDYPHPASNPFAPLSYCTQIEKIRTKLTTLQHDILMVQLSC